MVKEWRRNLKRVSTVHEIVYRALVVNKAGTSSQPRQLIFSVQNVGRERLCKGCISFAAPPYPMLLGTTLWGSQLIDGLVTGSVVHTTSS